MRHGVFSSLRLTYHLIWTDWRRRVSLQQAPDESQVRGETDGCLHRKGAPRGTSIEQETIPLDTVRVHFVLLSMLRIGGRNVDLMWAVR